MRNLHLVDSPSAPIRSVGLIERDFEVDAIRAAVRGGGGVVVLEAAAGLGKSVLLEHAGVLAEDVGWLVRRATPGPLEHHLPFGVIRALLETPVRESGMALDGPAAVAGSLLVNASAPGGNSSMMRIAHSVLWVCQELAAERPLALIVDDAHFADQTSLAVLAYLARRVEDLPLLLLIASRGSSDQLSVIGGSRLATVLRPQPLSPRNTLALLRRTVPHATVALGRECHRDTGGNPWLLSELARELARYGELRGRVSTEARGVVRQRLAELSTRDRGVVEALAVLGDGAPLHVIAAVAGVPVAEVAPARDALVATGLLASGGERFAHALIATAIETDLLQTERERLHREAARALMDGDPERVAAHLLECGPLGDPDVSAYLVRVAWDAPPRAAARYLERALAERAPGDDRAAIRTDLAIASFDAGLASARERLLAAARTPDVLSRLAALAFFEGGELDPDTDEVSALDALMAQPAERARRVRELAAAAADGERAAAAASGERAAAADGERGLAAGAGGLAATGPLLSRVVLAHRAWVAVEHGDPAAAALALSALDGDVLLGAAHQRGAYVLAVRTLVRCDHPDAAAAIAAVRDHPALPVRVAAAALDGELALRGGRLADAERFTRTALRLAGERFAPLTADARAVLVEALAERGAFEEAQAYASGPAQARLALAMGDFERAHAGAGSAVVAALALAHLGRRDEAAELADAELARARRFGAPVTIAEAYVARAVAEADPAARVAFCEAGLRAGAPGLASVRLRLELGSALAYMGRRVEAREALRPALADADAAGALPLSRRAHRELVATGLRPRQAAIEGTAALTPRQRQICELAAVGKGNRAIAQELFLSIKTVETHLAAGYRKLGVSTRAELAAELAA